MDIIEENKLLRENYALRQQNDRLKEDLDQWRNLAGSRRQILDEIAVSASEYLSSFERQKLFGHPMAEHVQGQLYAYETIFTRMRQLSKHDPDLLQIISDPLQRVESWTEYVQEEVRRMNEEHQAKSAKKKAAKA